MEQAKDGKGSEFHVLLSGLKLPTELEGKIAAGIQSVVSSALAGYKPNPDDPNDDDGPFGGGGPHIVIPPIRWRGIWIKVLNKDLVINRGEIEVQQKLLQKGVQVG